MEKQPKHWQQRLLTAGIWTLAVAFFALSVQADDKQQKPEKAARQPIASVVPQPTFYPILTEHEQRVEDELVKETTGNFPEIPLHEVITFFSELHNIPIQIQKKDLEEIGLSPDEPVDVNLKDISLKNALDFILEPLNLTYVVDHNMLLITSRQKAEQIFKTRVYPVGDLCSSSPEDYAVLEAVILNARVGRWSPAVMEQQISGYPAPYNKAGSNSLNLKGGTISGYPQSQSLVITQTYHAQKAIEKLLEDLRTARAAQQKAANKQ
ncbi:hypothetical protein [Gimesia panareensis]|uniref:Uncharacterized protein n=1 Tax=Gimesia panareensis TaxID=2527978 RepID=A0A518FQE4_9PLAN|nr:hypothetical protein [Gimesia panareensis]QDT25366.1 hypothetical protein Enr10x_06610 [Gimesia panareensis]QDU48326.1 hypothetical protein Pan110_06390 [Gimesia panareensis]QDV18572.1 hypothetical protein Pan153_32310 [Gimesia panareensis]